MKLDTKRLEEDIDVQELSLKEKVESFENSLNLDELLERLNKYSLQKEELEDDLDVVLSKFDRILEKLKPYDETDYECLKNDILNKNQALKTICSENNVLVADIDIAKAQIDYNQNKVIELNRLLSNLSDEREIARASYYQLLQEVKRIACDMLKISSDHERRGAQLRDLEQAHQANKLHGEEVKCRHEAEIQAKMEKISSMKQQYDDLLEEINTEKNRIDEMQGKSEMLDDRLNELNSSNEMMSSRIKLLKEEIKQNENELKILAMQKAVAESSDFWIKAEQLRFETEMVRSKLSEINVLIIRAKGKVSNEVYFY